MSKRLVVSVIVCSVVAGIAIGYVRGLPDDFVENDTAVQGASEYGYRCGDGTEFTLVPSADMQTIRITPATSVDYIRESKLVRKEINDGYVYTDGTITVDGIRERLDGYNIALRATGHQSTECKAMFLQESSEIVGR